MSIAARVVSTNLANGTRVHVLESHSNITVDLIGYLEGGLRLEAPCDAGVANLCVGALDRGTAGRTHAQIADALESCGAQVCFDLTPETTTFRTRCLSEDLATVLAILADCLADPSFPERQLKGEREETLAELRAAAFDSFARGYERAAGLVLGEDHIYTRDPLGREERVKTVSREQVRSFHRSLLRGSALHVAVVGNVRLSEVAGLLEDTVGSLPPAASSPAPPEVTPAPSAPAAANAASAPAAASAAPRVRREHVAMPDKDQVDLFFMGCGHPRTAPDFEAYALANFLVGGSFVCRLNQRLRDQEGLTYGAQSTIVSGQEAGLWYAYVSVHPRDVARTIELTQSELTRFVQDGPDDEELRMAKLHLTGSFPIKLEANRVVATVLLDSLRSGRGLDYIDRYCGRVMEISREQVLAAARGLWGAPEMAIVSAGAGLPEA